MSAPSLASTIARLKDAVAAKWDTHATHFRDEVRPLALDLTQRIAINRLRMARGDDTTTSDIALQAEASNMLVEERVALARVANEALLDSLLTVVVEILT